MANLSPLEPSEAEIEAWAAAEHRRRETWLSGPTAEQKQAWADRERERRLAERTGGIESLALNPARTAQRLVRTGQLVTEGAFRLMWKWSLYGLNALEQTGREWEEEFSPRLARSSQEARERARPRRITLDDEAPADLASRT